MRAKIILEALCAIALVAVSVTQGRAACLNPPVSPQLINQFKSNPKSLVTPDSDTRTIEALVRDLVGSDASLAADVVHVAEGTTPRFQTAIAAGLAQAAIACTSVDQQAALLIQQAVANFQDGQFQASFAAVAGDLSTAATAAATASATASVGSVIVTNPTTSQTSATLPGSAGGTSLPIQLTFAAGATSNSTATTAAEPVSPTR
jgi:hypothetical protein